MTIQQLEAFSNTKPELRYITEEIIKYLGANPPGSPGDLSYLVYTALMEQTGTNAPTVIEAFTNTLGEALTWTYDAIGVYSGVANGDIFPEGKTIMLITMGVGVGLNKSLQGGWESGEDYVVIKSYNGAGSAADIGAQFQIEIRVYP